MKTKLFIGFTMLFLSSTFLGAAQNINITINDITGGSKGKIYIAFFTSQKQFKSQKPQFIKSYSKSGVKNGKLNVVVSLKAGTYGLSILDDRNGDGVMAYNFLGIPKEGFGFSGFNLNKIKMPKFNDFKFTVDRDKNKSVKVKMKYLL